MMHVIKRKEMDRPSFHTLTYLTTVRAHPIFKEPIYVDDFNRAMIIKLIGVDLVKEFEETTRSMYTKEGHYENLWLYDQPIMAKPDDPIIDEAI